MDTNYFAKLINYMKNIQVDFKNAISHFQIFSLALNNKKTASQDGLVLVQIIFRPIFSHNRMLNL